MWYLHIGLDGDRCGLRAQLIQEVQPPALNLEESESESSSDGEDSSTESEVSVHAPYNESGYESETLDDTSNTEEVDDPSEVEDAPENLGGSYALLI